jgi:hypothetical protein
LAKSLRSNKEASMGNLRVELFDVHNRINFPQESDIAALPAEVQEKFKTVRAAKEKLDAATELRVMLDQKITRNDAARLAVDTELKAIRPVWTETDNIKAHIASERAQRALERGY